jgi:LAS superfamily LD-carboxypeptidase LdcB
MATMTKEELIDKLGIASVDQETQEKMLQNVGAAVSSRIMNKVTENLSDEDIDKLSDMIDRNDDAGVENLIKSKYPNYDEFAMQVENEVIEELATDGTRLRSTMAPANTEAVAQA